MKLSDIKPNPNNPRLIKDDKFQKLVNSIREFPKMMSLRPMVVNSENIILGGNMRFKALKELGYKDIPDDWVKRADELTDDEARRFIIADNVEFGDDDWTALIDGWDVEKLDDWGLKNPFKTVDISKTEPPEKTKTIPAKQYHVLISFDMDQFQAMNDFIVELQKNKAIEIEKAFN
jgi:hypothetical protein